MRLLPTIAISLVVIPAAAVPCSAAGGFAVTNSPVGSFGGWAATDNAKSLVGDFNGDGKADVAPTGGASPAVRVVDMIPATLSGETNQDSEPFLAINAGFGRMAGTAFTPNPVSGGDTAPIYVSLDSGRTWVLNNIVPSSDPVVGTGDITVAGVTGSARENRLYSGFLALPGYLLLKETTTPDFTSAVTMTTQSSRGSVDQPFVQGWQSASGVDHVFVGNNDLSSRVLPKSATVDVSADGGTTWSSVRIEKRTPNPQDGPSIRPAVAADGTVYAAFFSWHSFNDSFAKSDVVVVRDDSWGTGENPFTALVDEGDGIAGKRVVTNVKIPWVNGQALGHQRIGSTLSLAVDLVHSNVVYIGWADRVGNGDIYTIHVQRSIDRGVTWSGDLMTLTNAANIALAVDNGVVGVLYQQVIGSGASERWLTALVQTRNDFDTTQVTVLATTPTSTPSPVFQPYIGDYVHLLAGFMGFRGIFSANNTPNRDNFPQGVVYQRQVDFDTQTLRNGSATVAPSIDPFYFTVEFMKK